MTSVTAQTDKADRAPSRQRWWRLLTRAVIALVAFLALVAFSAVLARLTLTPSPASDRIAGSNLRPGASLRQYAQSYTFLAACKQIGGNLLLGAPFGLLLPVLVARRMRMVRVLLVTAIVMVLVELAQGALVRGRAFDVDDVILNTAGALIAYLLVGRRIGHGYHALAGPSQRERLPITPEGKDSGHRDATHTGDHERK
ncbi:VanZ family protein [Streptomyces sp. NPDC102406]|uniref:VanZ family protein n=1 Tax=Streptomyces sp. NPDC102406 TaxID=3366171 RepID=UPI0037FCD4A8